MKMSNERKKEVLLKNFEIINKNFSENGRSLREIVVKMFSIDIDTGIEMWKYLIKEYTNEIIYGDSWCLTGGIYFETSRIIGEGKMDSIVLNTPEFKQTIFSIASSVNLSANIIIRNIIDQNDTSLTNELLELLYNNQHREKNWYEIMDDIIPSHENMSDEMYELLEMWCDKVENEEERAKLSIKMLDYIE